MRAIPESLKRLSSLLKGQFDLDLAITKKSEAVFQVDILQAPIIILFYLSSSFHIIHQEIRLANKRIIHIDEDLLLSRQEVVISRLAVAAGKAKKVYARETSIARIHKEEALQFQAHHHLQIPLPGKYRFGLFYQEELLSVAIFSGGRKMNQQPDTYRSFELLRFCHKTGHLVTGGVSKLMHGMIRHFSPGDIMTYVDRDWSDGRNYEKLGFENLGAIASQKFYIDQLTGIRQDEKAHHIVHQAAHNLAEAPYTTVVNLGSIKMRYSV